jgi:hypothetical protein
MPIMTPAERSAGDGRVSSPQNPYLLGKQVIVRNGYSNSGGLDALFPHTKPLTCILRIVDLIVRAVLPMSDMTV